LVFFFFVYFFLVLPLGEIKMYIFKKNTLDRDYMQNKTIENFTTCLDTVCFILRVTTDLKEQNVR